MRTGSASIHRPAGTPVETAICRPSSSGRAASRARAASDPHLHALGAQRDLAAADARDVEQVVDQPRHVPDLAAQHRARARRYHRVVRPHLQELERGEHGRERVAQLVRQHGQELVLAPVRLLRLAVQAGVVEGEARAPAEVLGDRQVGRAVAPRGRGGHERDRPQRPAARDEGYAHGEGGAQLVDQPGALRGWAEAAEQQVERLGAQARTGRLLRAGVGRHGRRQPQLAQPVEQGQPRVVRVRDGEPPGRGVVRAPRPRTSRRDGGPRPARPWRASRRSRGTRRGGRWPPPGSAPPPPPAGAPPRTGAARRRTRHGWR